MPVIDVRHPLVKHKVGLLRETDISTKKFRELTHELARLLAYEATADFPLETATIDCWSGPTEVQRIAGRKVNSVRWSVPSRNTSRSSLPARLAAAVALKVKWVWSQAWALASHDSPVADRLSATYGL